MCKQNSPNEHVPQQDDGLIRKTDTVPTSSMDQNPCRTARNGPNNHKNNLLFKDKTIQSFHTLKEWAETKVAIEKTADIIKKTYNENS